MNRKVRWSTCALVLTLLVVSLVAVPQASAHTVMSTGSMTKQQVSVEVLYTDSNFDCAAGSYMQVQWWGVSMRLPHCLAQELEHAGNFGAAIATAGAALCSGGADLPCDAVVAVAVAALWGSAEYVGAVDDSCGDQGVFLNVFWWGGATVTRVC